MGVNIEVVTTSFIADIGVHSSARVPTSSEASLVFSFEAAGSYTGNVYEESPPQSLFFLR